MSVASITLNCRAYQPNFKQRFSTDGDLPFPIGENKTKEIKCCNDGSGVPYYSDGTSTEPTEVRYSYCGGNYYFPYTSPKTAPKQEKVPEKVYEAKTSTPHFSTDGDLPFPVGDSKPVEQHFSTDGDLPFPVGDVDVIAQKYDGNKSY